MKKTLKAFIAAAVSAAAISMTAVPSFAMEGSCELNFNYYSQSTWEKTSSEKMTLSENGTYTLQVTGLEEDPSLVGSIFLKDAAEMPSGLSDISVNVDSFKVNGSEIALSQTNWDILDGTCFEVTLVNAWADSFADISGCGTINDMEITFTVTDYGAASADTVTETADTDNTSEQEPVSDNLSESPVTGNTPCVSIYCDSNCGFGRCCIYTQKKVISLIFS